MSADISRSTFDPAKHFRRVRIQQGRVQLDSDWNEQVDILLRQARETTRDLVGADGAPAARAGMRLLVNDALSFDGVEDFAVVGPSPSLEFPRGRPFSIVARVRRQSAGGTVIASCDRGRWCQFALLIQPNGRLQLVLGDDADGNEVCVYSTQGVPSDSWCDVAATWNGHVARLYIDAKCVGEAIVEYADEAGLGPVDGRPLWIGCMPEDESRKWFFAGDIASLQLWGTERSVAQLPQAPTPDSPGLVGWWPMDEGAGSSAADSGPYSNDATLGDGFDDEMPNWGSGEVTISEGHFYASGELVENERRRNWSRQPFRPDASLPPDSGLYLGFLDVWERSITPTQDPQLLDPALGGVSTTTRSQTVWQCDMLPVAPVNSNERGPSWPAWDSYKRQRTAQGSLRAWRRSQAPRFGNLLYRVQLGCGGGRYEQPRSATAIAGFVEATVDPDLHKRVHPDSVVGLQPFWPAGQLVEVVTRQPDRTTPGKLTWVRVCESQSGSLRLAHGFDAERVWIRRIAGYSWSRENGTVTLPVNGVSKSTDGTGIDQISLAHPIGYQGNDLAVGDLVEFATDHTVLARIPQRPIAIKSILDPHTIVLVSPLGQGALQDGKLELQSHPFIRRWDQRATDAGLLPVRRKAVELEQGIEVEFTTSEYGAGNHWLIPSRESTPSLLWPTDSEGQPAEVQARTPQLALTKLALLRHEGSAWILVQDHVRTFGTDVGGYVNKAGDTMTGPLTVDSRLTVTGISRLGVTRVQLLEGELAANIVGTAQLIPGAVTADRLAPDAGIVPVGAFLLGSSAVPPSGYASTGARIAIQEPVEQPWHDLPALPAEAALEWTKLVSWNGTVLALLAGGEVWEWTAPEWSPRPDLQLPEQLTGFAATTLNGRVHVVGGFDGSSEVASHYALDPASGEWQGLQALPARRAYLGLAATQGRLHAMGGEGEFFFFFKRLSRRHWSWDPATDGWSSRQPLPHAASAFTTAVVGSRILVAGGYTHPWWHFTRQPSQAVVTYAPNTDAWDPRMALAAPRTDAAMTQSGGRVVLAGGLRDGSPTAAVEIYEPALDDWRIASPLTRARAHAGMVDVAGELLVAGGADGGTMLPTEARRANELAYLYQKVDTPAIEVVL